jgi:predicted nucleic acid-binding protein
MRGDARETSRQCGVCRRIEIGINLIEVLPFDIPGDVNTVKFVRIGSGRKVSIADHAQAAIATIVTANLANMDEFKPIRELKVENWLV